MKLAAIPGILWNKTKRTLEYIPFFWNRFLRQITLDKPPAFIVGCGHSGTSVLLAILGAHPRIYPIPYESYIATIEDEKRFKKYIKRLNRSAIAYGKHRWLEKTPIHILHIGKILKWIPDAKIIIVLRDGRDVAWSIKQRSGSLENGIKRWYEHNLSGKAYWNNPNVYVVKYEKLVSDFESTISGILSFLGETYDSGMKDFHKNKKRWYARTISKPPTAFGKHHGQYRNWQIHQPLFDGRGRWKDLSTDELDYIENVAGSLLAECGYTRKPDS